MSDERKLLRGLSDISSLFEKKREGVLHESVIKETIPPRFHGISCVSLWDSTPSSISSPVTRWLAYQLAGMKISTSVLKLQDPAGSEKDSLKDDSIPLDQEFLQFIALSSDQWEEVGVRSSHGLGLRTAGEVPSEVLFFDLPFTLFKMPEILSSVMDQFIFMVDESGSSLEGAYRLIKKIRQSGSSAELGLIFKGIRSQAAGERLYERFSALLSRHLGTEINWMGYLTYYPEIHIPCLQFSPLQMVHGFSKNSGREKLKEEFVHNLRRIIPGIFRAEVHQQGA